jgi:hypothetical protein
MKEYDMHNFKEEIENSFSFLTKFGFTISIIQSVDVIAIFTCPSFKIRLIQYHQELYLEFSKTISNECIDEERWIAFCWLIEYLSCNDKYKTNYFNMSSIILNELRSRYFQFRKN